MALVVQPGVEFDHLRVIDYAREHTTDLQHVLDGKPNIVFEAHSTDYQTVETLRRWSRTTGRSSRSGPA